MWSVYLLQELGGNKTYIGATLDVERRLNQHNGLQSGGAKATWETMVSYVSCTRVS